LFSSKSEEVVPPVGLKKIYYSIREVSELTGVEPHVLRFWEKKFPMLRPRRGRSGNRTYKERDIEIVKEIRHLLWDQKFTIQLACKQLRKSRSQPNEKTVSQPELPFADVSRDTLSELRAELVEIRNLLTGKGRS
jgi:DNA-binding transcriptional MerR regulator